MMLSADPSDGYFGVTFIRQFCLQDEVQLSLQLQMLSAAAKGTGTF